MYQDNKSISGAYQFKTISLKNEASLFVFYY